MQKSSVPGQKVSAKTLSVPFEVPHKIESSCLSFGDAGFRAMQSIRVYCLTLVHYHERPETEEGIFSLKLKMEKLYEYKQQPQDHFKSLHLTLGSISSSSGSPGHRPHETDYQSSLCWGSFSDDDLCHSSFPWIMCLHIIPNSAGQNYIHG